LPVDSHRLPFLQYLSETFRQGFSRFADHLTGEDVPHRVHDYRASLSP
jgi:hypothetical protein